ncbi:MAG: hypothetical protein NTU94_00240, partial [Planctomycetota bacterium]|nr:hypothetical protein [Planctomycetota bacterium]
ADGNDHLVVAEDEYRGVKRFDLVISPSGLPDALKPQGFQTEDLPMTIVAGGGNDVIDLRQFRGDVTVLGGAGDDTVNIGDGGSLSGVHGQVYFDGNAHILEQQRNVNASEYTNALMDTQNLPKVFTDSAPTQAFVDSGGRILQYALPVLNPILVGDGLAGTIITGSLRVRAVVLYTQNEQLKGAQEYGVQKKDLSGNALWFGLDGNETVDSGQTGLPVITRVDRAATGARAVYLDAKGQRVFANTGVLSIVDPLGSDTPQNVYIDSSGNRTFTVTGQKAWAHLKGDIVEDLVQEKGVQEWGLQKLDGGDNPLYYDEVGGETTDSTKTGLPVILTANPGDVDALGNPARLVYLDGNYNRIFLNPADVGPTSRKSFITDFGASSKYLYVDSRGFKLDEYPSIFVRNGAGVDFLVYQSDTVGGASNWAGLKVEVSWDGTTWYTATSHATSARITGDGLHNDPSNVLRRGYDLGDLRDAGDNAASLALIRRIRLTCTSGTFKVDAVGILSTGMGPEGVVFPTLVSENTTGN